MRTIKIAAVVTLAVLGCSGRYEIGAMNEHVASIGNGAPSGTAGHASSVGTAGKAGKATSNGDAGQAPGSGGTSSGEVGGSSPTEGGAAGSYDDGQIVTAGTLPTGGSKSTGGSSSAGGGTSVCDGKTSVSPAYIDNFDTDAHFGGWYAFSDTTPPNMPLPSRVNLGALNTPYSGHFSATDIRVPQQMGYGAGFGFALVSPPQGNCVDLSAFSGISFWIKGTTNADNTLKFQIVSALTQPADALPVGDCPSSFSACAWRHPSKTIILTPGWEHIVINFADLVSVEPFVASKVMGLNLITDAPNYDVQIDEVTFFKTAAPTGPVNP